MEIGLKSEINGCHGNQVTILAYTVYMYCIYVKFKAFISGQKRRLYRFMRQIADIVVGSNYYNKYKIGVK